MPQSCLNLASIFGPMNEIVRFCPVSKQTAQQLRKTLMDVIKFVQGHGFDVVGVVGDGHPINAKLFDDLTNERSPDDDDNALWFENPHPEKHDKRIYVMFDTVHIYKNTRNSWMGRNELTMLHYNQFAAGEEEVERVKANFLEVRREFEKNAGQITPDGYRIDYITVNPCGSDKQKVKHVDNLYHLSSIAAMTKAGLTGEAMFSTVMNEYWQIMNTKNSTYGRRLRLPLMSPFTRQEWLVGTDIKIPKLKEILNWLEAWCGSEEFENRCLTMQTYNAMRHTIKVHISIVDYLFTTYDNFEYLLPSKLQTDQLEARFGKLRHFAGSGYQISTRQILAGEKNMRLRKICKVSASIREAMADIDHESDDEEIDLQLINGVISKTGDHYPFEDIIDAEAPIDPLPDQLELEDSINWMAGVVARRFIEKMRKKANACAECIDDVQASRGMMTNRLYFNLLQRGGLIDPQTFAKMITRMMYKILDAILADPDHCKIFRSPRTNQRHELIRHTVLALKTCGLPIPKLCSTCQMPAKEKVAIMLLPLANTLLKADSKRTNNIHLLQIRDRNRIRREKKLQSMRRAAERELQPERPPSVAQRRRALRLSNHVSEVSCTSTEGETDFDPREDGDAYLNDIEHHPNDPASHRNIASTSAVSPTPSEASDASMPPPQPPQKRSKSMVPTARVPSMRINARKFATSKKKALKVRH